MFIAFAVSLVLILLAILVYDLTRPKPAVVNIGRKIAKPTRRFRMPKTRAEKRRQARSEQKRIWHLMRRQYRRAGYEPRFNLKPPLSKICDRLQPKWDALARAQK